MDTKELEKAVTDAIGEFKGHAVKVDERFKILDEFKSRMDAFETRLGRPPMNNQMQPEVSLERKAFLEYLRTGSISPEARKDLLVSKDPTGGHLAPPEYRNEIIKGIVDFSPVRPLANVINTSAHSVMIPRKVSALSASWVGEVAARAETTGDLWGMVDLAAHELSAYVDVSQQNIEDSAFNLEQLVMQEFSEQFGVAEAVAFIAGTGVGQPEGLINAPGLTGGITTASATAITADEVIDLYYALAEPYAKNAYWLANRSTIQYIRKLKDSGTPGQYLWQPGLTGSQPGVILGRPVVECKDMESIAATKKVLAFGDFKRAYTIVDRVQMNVLRDPYTQATNALVRFIARKRVGGMVVLPEAMKLLTMKA